MLHLAKPAFPDIRWRRTPCGPHCFKACTHGLVLLAQRHRAHRIARRIRRCRHMHGPEERRQLIGVTVPRFYRHLCGTDPGEPRNDRPVIGVPLARFPPMQGQRTRQRQPWRQQRQSAHLPEQQRARTLAARQSHGKIFSRPVDRVVPALVGEMRPKFRQFRMLYAARQGPGPARCVHRKQACALAERGSCPWVHPVR